MISTIVSSLISIIPSLQAPKFIYKQHLIGRRSVQVRIYSFHAIWYAKLMITSSNFFISETSSDPMYELAKNYKPEGDEIFASSWARHQGHEKLYG